MTMPMHEELRSTARPTPLRAAGFLAVVLGAAAAGIGALLTWATVGFVPDRAHELDIVVKGVDIWEGTVVLVVALGALIAVVAMRLTRSDTARAGLSVAIALGGIVVAVVATVDLVTADNRFVGSSGLDRVAREIATRVPGRSFEQIRALLERNTGALVRVDVGPGIPLALVGGVLLVAGGALSLAWARGRRAETED